MLEKVTPTTEQELADALAGSGGTIHLTGAASKLRVGGTVAGAVRQVSTLSLNQVLKYEPRDLTISVQAGMKWKDLAALLAENRQTIPLDPPYFEDATVGGVVAANSSGPRRRLYGTARDLVIGMRFATLEGKIVQTGGMVVKNVAGLDMAKLLIGSFGTLAAIASVNFKLIPLPLEHRTFVLEFESAEHAIGARDLILQSVLQPAAVDLIHAGGAWQLAVEAGGNAALMARYEKELSVRGVEDYDWSAVREFNPRFLAAHADGCVARVSATLTQLRGVLESAPGAVLARAANGVAWLHFESPGEANAWADRAEREGWRFVFESGIERDSAVFAAGFAMMKKVKDLFDPRHLLNPGRLYGRI